MSEPDLRRLALAQDQKLKNIWFDRRDSLRIKTQIADAYDEIQYALSSKTRFEAPGLAILGKSGSGKTNSVVHALERLGLKATLPGDTSRPVLECALSARATLRDLSEEILRSFGWEGVNRPLFAGDPEVRILGYGKEQMWK